MERLPLRDAHAGTFFGNEEGRIGEV